MTYNSSDGTIKTHELIILSDVEEIKCYDIKDEASNPKQIGNGWRDPRSYM